MQRRRFRIQQSLIESLILLPIKRAVDIVVLPTVVPRGEKDLLPIERIECHDGSSGIVKTQQAAAEGRNLLCQQVRCKRTGCDYYWPICRQPSDLPDNDFNVFPCTDFLGHQLGKGIPVNGKRSACCYTRLQGTAHRQRTHHRHLCLEHPCCGTDPLRLERIGADQLCKLFTVMGRGKLFWLHLIQPDGNPCIGERPSRLAAG